MAPNANPERCIEKSNAAVEYCDISDAGRRSRSLSPSDSHSVVWLNAACLGNRADSMPCRYRYHIYTLEIMPMPPTFLWRRWLQLKVLLGFSFSLVLVKNHRGKLAEKNSTETWQHCRCECVSRSYRVPSLRPPSVVRSPRGASPRRLTACAQCERSAR